MKTAYQNRPWPFKSYHVNNYTFTPHLHNQIEIVYVVSGSCSMTINETTYTAAAGNFILIFPYEIHSFYQPLDCELIVQTFNPDYSPVLIPFLDKYIPATHILESIPSDCLQAILKAEEYFISQADPQIIRAYVSLFMSFLYQKIYFIPISEGNQNDIIYTLLIYINQHFSEHLSLEILAHELNVSKYYISRIFTKKLKISFPDYLNSLRLEYAIELLINSDSPIYNIAFECGFDCERTFYRVFKKHMNMTPLQYRYSLIHAGDHMSFPLAES